MQEGNIIGYIVVGNMTLMFLGSPWKVSKEMVAIRGTSWEVT